MIGRFRGQYVSDCRVFEIQDVNVEESGEQADLAGKVEVKTGTTCVDGCGNAHP